MRRQAATALLFLAASLTVTAGAARGDAGPLRIGTSGDYAPFSSAVGEGTVSFEGFDIELFSFAGRICRRLSLQTVSTSRCPV